METKFEQKLEFGKIAEKEIEEYMLKKGWSIIPSYDYTGKNAEKSPRMFNAKSKHAIPDMDCSKSGKRIWVEVKHNTNSAFNRKLGKNVHGIKRRLYNDYLRVEKETGNIVYLFIKEVETRKILYAKLSDLNKYNCQCDPCRNMDYMHCKSPIKDEVYFLREQFSELIDA